MPHCQVTIGKIGDPCTLKEARKKAKRLSVAIDEGSDPRVMAAAERDAAETNRIEGQHGKGWSWRVSGALIDDCKPFWGERHAKMHELLAAPGGVKKKRGKGTTKPGPFAPLMGLKLAELTHEVIAPWLKREAAKRSTNAHQSFRLLKTFIRWANEQPACKGIIPPDACSHSRVMCEVPTAKVKRNDCLQEQQLPAWFKAVNSAGNRNIAVYLQVLLLIGCGVTN